jgi:hypothetical protein
MLIASMLIGLISLSSAPVSTPQELVGAIQWGFESPLPHH